MTATREHLEAVIREQLGRVTTNAIMMGVPSRGMFNRAVEEITRAASLCTSCIASYDGDLGIVVHEDGCPQLAELRGHDCRADASGFCGHPAHTGEA